MLVLSRRLNEAISIDANIRIRILKIQGSQVRIGIEAPDEVGVRRMELDIFSADPKEESYARPVSPR